MTGRIFISIFIGLLNFIHAPSADSTRDTFHEFLREVNHLEEQKNYTAAIELSRSVWPLFPDNRFELIKELEFLYEKTGQYENNLSLWEEGHAGGYFFLLNRRMKKYEPYLHFSVFDNLVSRDSLLRETALKESKSIYQIANPESIPSSGRLPLLIILHGGGSSLEKAMQRWRLFPVLKSKLLVVFIQSYLHYDSQSFGWRSGDDRIHREIRAIFSEIAGKFPVDTSRVLLGGTSAGGTMALDLAFRNIIPVSGIIAFCPGRPREFNPDSISNKKIQIFMLGGENDYYLPRQKELAQLFRQAGIQYIHQIVPGMGHEFPSSYVQVLTEALNWFNF